jgi:lipid-A-disaccharide synthase
MPRIVIIAGEVSGDRLGASLITALKGAGAADPGREAKNDFKFSFSGVAGPAMAAAGCEVWHPSETLAVMGLVEVLRHLPRLRRVFRDLERRLRTDPPDLLIGIDAPDFNLRLEKLARSLGIPVVHYVSPSVWAWRAGRVKVLAAACDSVLCLLPFEAEFLNRRGVRGVFVGHPLADELPDNPDAETARQRLGLAGPGPVVAVLPGSRAGEVERLGPVFAATAAWLAAREPGLRFVAPMATPALAELFAAQWRAAAGHTPLHLLDGQSHEAMAASTVVLLASGTATLEAMLVRRPMVVAYKVSSLTYALVRGLNLVNVPHVALPNLLAGERLVPELIQDEATPEALGQATLEWLRQPAQTAAVCQRFAQMRVALQGGASELAAAEVRRVLAGRTTTRPQRSV